MAVQGKDFIVTGTDSRGTFGDYRVVTATTDVMIKSSVIAPHVVVLVAGISELGDSLVDEFQSLQRQRNVDGITNVVNLFRKFVQEKWSEYFKDVPFQNRPPLVFTLAGLDKMNDIYTLPRIYTLMSQLGFAPGLHRYGFACTGVPQYAVYILNRRYRPDLTIDELTGLVAYAISETASQDQRVGGLFRISHITKDGVRELSQEEITRALQMFIRKLI
jgi:20S proteasome alpha/beta subunit